MADSADTDTVIEVEGLSKSFGPVRALDAVGFAAERGSVLGLLGPRGAGKTTCVRVLATLLAPDAGSVRVEGWDVVADAPRLRHFIGYVAAGISIDLQLTGRENLELVAGLYRLAPYEARFRAEELLVQLGLEDGAAQPAGTYPPDMRRKLDLAASLVHRPAVLVLDEPTAGLEAAQASGIWDAIRAVASYGATVVLTTESPDEADALCNTIVVMDAGRVVAAGPPAGLRALAGGDVLELVCTERADVRRAAAALARIGTGAPTVDLAGATVTVPVGTAGAERLAEAVRVLDGALITPAGLGLRHASLDEMLLALVRTRPLRLEDSRSTAELETALAAALGSGSRNT